MSQLLNTYKKIILILEVDFQKYILNDKYKKIFNEFCQYKDYKYHIRY